MLGKGVAPAANRAGRGQTVRCTLALGLMPRGVVLEARHDDLLDDDQQVVAEAQQKTGQNREGRVASLAEPAFDPNPVDLGLIFGLARVKAVADEGVQRGAERTAFWARKDDLVEMHEVILDSAATIQYNRHLFVLNPTPRTAAKQSPRGRVLPFGQNQRPSLPDFAPGRQPRPAFGQWPPGDSLSPGTPCANPTHWLLLTKKAAHNGRPDA